MDVITIPSDSDDSHQGPDGNLQGLQNFDDDDIYNVDWNDDAGIPSINYDEEPINENASESKLENQIEEFIMPAKIPKNNSNKLHLDEETEDYLPDIINSSYNEPLPSQSCSQSKPKQVRQKLSQEDKEQAKFLKEQKKLERDRIRGEKKFEQQRQKAYKAVFAENQRNLKPEENIKFLKVHIDNEIINSPCGGNIISVLQQSNIQYLVEAQIKNNTITWSKRRVEKVVDDFGEVSENIISKDEEQLLYVLDWESTLRLVHANELLSHVEVVKSNYIDKRLTLIIYGIEKYFEYKRNKRNREMKAEINDRKKVKPKSHERVYEEAPNVSRDQLEYALTDLQLFGKHNCRLLETPEELSALVLNFTKSLSQIEFKLEKQKRQEENLGWFAPGENQSIKVDKNGNGLLRLWQQQICQFSSVGLETAQAIVSHFNSPLALMTQYENCLDSKEGELLLQNIQIRREAGILSSTRRVGPQLSKKIYKFLTSDDPEEEL